MSCSFCEQMRARLLAKAKTISQEATRFYGGFAGGGMAPPTEQNGFLTRRAARQSAIPPINRPSGHKQSLAGHKQGNQE